LRDNGFPIGIQGTELIMKPTAQTQDAIFKQQVTNYLRHYGKVIATFDNEPANANVFRRAFPSAVIMAFDAPHSPNPPPLLPEVQKLASFE
ncbi:MAG: haloacid dehalogenase-like hydrolase, partial [Myxococcota bacterium]